MSVRAIPPGIRFLAPVLPKLSIIPLVIVLARRLLFPSLSAWLTVLACISVYPAILTVIVQYDKCKKALKARRMGCELPVPIDYNFPGGLGMLSYLKTVRSSRFPGYAFYKWSSEYGPTFNMRTLFKDRIFTCDPECLKRILSTEFTSFEKGPDFKSQMQDFLGDGVFNADGDVWRFHRAMTRPFFARDRISHFDIFDRHTEDAFRQMATRLEEGCPVDFQEVALRITLDSASEFLLGMDVRSLSSSLSYPPTSTKSSHSTSANTRPPSSFAEAFYRAQFVTCLRPFYGGMWPLFEFWEDKLAEPMKTIGAFVQPVIAAALNKKAHAQNFTADFSTESDAKENVTVLEHLVKQTDNAKIIQDETLNVLLAGRDTTASTLTLAMYMLAEHPEAAKKLRGEILEYVGLRRPTFDDIRKMKYLRAFINEILRLYPPVPYNIRWAVKDSVWPSHKPGGKPLLVEANTGIIFSVLVMHRRADLWGPDAAEFDPDRFLDDRCQRYLVPNPFIFLPFNAGPRICLGQQFAYNEISFVLIRLLQQFSGFELAQEEANPQAIPSREWATTAGTNGKDRVRVKHLLTLAVEGGLWVRMKRENSAG